MLFDSTANIATLISFNFKVNEALINHDASEGMPLGSITSPSSPTTDLNHVTSTIELGADGEIYSAECSTTKVNPSVTGRVQHVGSAILGGHQIRRVLDSRSIRKAQ